MKNRKNALGVIPLILASGWLLLPMPPSWSSGSLSLFPGPGGLEAQTVGGTEAAQAGQVVPGPAELRAREVLATEVFGQVEAAAATARAEGLPTEPVYLLALQGVAKGIPTDRIVPGLSLFVERLLNVREFLGPGVDEGVLIAAHDAVRRGVPGESLAGLEPDQRSPMALTALADLVEAGVPVDDALGVVREAVLRRQADDTMLALGDAVRGLIRDGRSAQAAADAVRRALRDGRPIREFPSVGPDGVRIGAPAPPGSDPVSRDRRTAGGGG